jgi:predicted RNase H-like HicB family nuclease
MEQHSQAGRNKGKRKQMKYAVVYERSPRNYAAYVPDLPGCIATGKTRPEVERRIRSAIKMHLDGLNNMNLRKDRDRGNR